ncbi:M28 family peptidase, partial [Thiocapsa sp.]|uniref:M28 family peptidase n=1 Tax=Thiocapsa sp. TaxID=2024551 RepID=UPI003594522E
AVEPAEAVFAGYGIVAPAAEGQPAYDSYRDLDVADRWVLAFRGLPEDVSPERRQHLSEFADLRFKAMVAREQGARGLILVSGPSTRVKDQLVALENEAGAGPGSLPVMSVTDAVGQQLLAPAGKDLAAVQQALDGGEAVSGFVLPTLRLAADIRLQREESLDRNVLGRLVAGERPSEQVVIVGAHVDHIGDGTGLDSRDDTPGRIHPGADDNASGVSALLEIAEDLASRKAGGALDLRHDVIFAAWTGEEMGRLGSAAFVEARSSGDADLGGQVLAYLNLDMIGRLDSHLSIQGAGSSSLWRGEIERRNVPVGLPLQVQDDAYLPTDSTSFYLAGVPVLSFFTGVHQDYNTSRDTADRLNYEGLTRIARLAGLLAAVVAVRDTAPEYIAQEKPSTGANRANLRAYLGTIPAYDKTDLKGVLVDGVAKDGPAERGGMRAGDLIVSVASRRIENIYDYTYALNALKAEEPVTVTVERDGTEQPLSIVPAARE